MHPLRLMREGELAPGEERVKGGGGGLGRGGAGNNMSNFINGRERL